MGASDSSSELYLTQHYCISIYQHILRTRMQSVGVLLFYKATLRYPALGASCQYSYFSFCDPFGISYWAWKNRGEG